MAAGRTSKSLVGRRRRIADEGEEDDDPLLEGDSQSENSAATGLEDVDADGSSMAGTEEPESITSTRAGNSARENRGKTTKRGSNGKHGNDGGGSVKPPPKFLMGVDTEAMMNGLKGEQSPSQPPEAMVFDASDQDPANRSASSARNNGSMPSAVQQRKEHDESKQQRAANPAFIPNRGNFFMHDNRAHQNAPMPHARGAWPGRGRGRGGYMGGAANQPTFREQPAQQPWKHDLHDTINEEPQPQMVDSTNASQGPPDHSRPNPRQPPPLHTNQSRLVSFSSTTLVRNVQIRVSLPGMKGPVTFSSVPWKQHVRLPDHRPPLRRDKPIRVSLPGTIQRYIFPSAERSFIFIPRQMRPHQQRFGQGTYHRNIGGMGYSSRRTSMYGGSVYSAASRRSSFAGTNRDMAFSPVGSLTGAPAHRPVVRLPHGMSHHQGPSSAYSTPAGPLSGQQTPTGALQVHTYPLPQQPACHGIAPTTMHQPRPQKQISVTGIESPAVVLPQPPPPPSSSEAPPFHSQLPPHMAGTPQHHMYPVPLPPSQFSQYPHPPSQPLQAATPLSGIPEQAIHAATFHPPPPPYHPHAPSYYPYPHPQPYYYPPIPLYIPPPQPQQPMPPSHPPQPPTMHPPSVPPAPPSAPPQHEQQQRPPPASQSGMVAHESHGMVFYVPASEAAAQNSTHHYQPAESFVPSYAMPGLPPPTPAPEGASAADGCFYAPAAGGGGELPGTVQGMHEVGSGVYYPAGSEGML